MYYYDVLNNGMIIQTDLTRSEIGELFDISADMVNKMLTFGKKYMGQYEVVESVLDEPVPEELAQEWNTYTKKLRRLSG
ncbi:MAG: hypothetical protein IKL07_05125 [Clostridium sp.]|nr:hypothetical protein [Clostridium sp.]